MFSLDKVKTGMSYEQREQRCLQQSIDLISKDGRLLSNSFYNNNVEVVKIAISENPITIAFADLNPKDLKEISLYEPVKLNY